MMVVFAIAIGILVIAIMGQAVMPLEEQFHNNRTQQIRYNLSSLMRGIEEYRQQNPAVGYVAPSVLVTLPGYEYLRFSSPESFSSSINAGLSDGVWRFDRAAFWFESPFDAVGNAAYVQAANNTCGSTDITAGSSWCGRANSVWGKLENKETHTDLLLGEKQRLHKIVSKLYRRYSHDQTFAPLANGKMRTLAQLVGYAGAANACSGVFVYNQMPFDCDDLFNYWGIPIAFNKITDNHVALVNRTLVLSATGQPVRIAEEAKLE